MPPTPTPTPILVKIVSEDADFWNQPLFVAILALLGVALGAGVTVFTNRQLARAEDRRQWDEKILDYFLQIRDASDAFTEVHNTGDTKHFNELGSRQEALLPVVRNDLDRLGLIAASTVKPGNELYDLMDRVNRNAIAATYDAGDIAQLSTALAKLEKKVRSSLRLR